jgi:lipoyl(octanoyl) transferase
VSQLEQVLLSVLLQYKIDGSVQCGAPGVYVKKQKIASIGLRVKNGCTYHGISLNVDMDLKPFSGINPCGFAKMEMAQISDFYPTVLLDEVIQRFTHCFLQQFDP